MCNIVDLLAELEHMATPATDIEAIEIKADLATAERWRKLFGYSHDDAIERIEHQCSDLSALSVSSELWEMAYSEMEPIGYDREASEHRWPLGSRRRRWSQHPVRSLERRRCT
ncbi:hypothetical protein BJ170DRAFT_402231 [Xylariales sp. AK1849]|nr:hypothetical protein BJ170DRAFT_402231 [Xylariales sp. AK1849]